MAASYTDTPRSHNVDDVFGTDRSWLFGETVDSFPEWGDSAGIVGQEPCGQVESSDIPVDLVGHWPGIPRRRRASSWDTY
ncbi:MAG: hypothetical protein JWN52_5915 [Actinomycetia bacterium]|nr:hypothetical protein [Actinomycetes bacterium]